MVLGASLVTLAFQRYSLLITEIYGKRDDFIFAMVNIPFLSSNIPSTPDYGVYHIKFKILMCEEN